jgi:hypothetical protein
MKTRRAVSSTASVPINVNETPEHVSTAGVSVAANDTTVNILRYTKAGKVCANALVAANWDVKTSISFHSICFLTDDWWNMHEYSWNDIVRTVESIDDAALLWRVVAASGGTMPLRALKPSMTTAEFVVGGLAEARRAVLTFAARSHGHKKGHGFPNKLNCPGDVNTPPLPVHDPSPEQRASITQCFGSSPVNEQRSYNCRYSWKSMEVVPHSYCRRTGLLQMVRVLPLHEYCSQFGAPSCLADTPFQYDVGSVPHYECLDAFWLRWPRNEGADVFQHSAPK